MSSTPHATEAIDGRTARAVRTRDAIVDACIELVTAGDLRPTAPRIAERAGVSVRSIFQHFDDLETLFGAVGERVIARLGQLMVPIDVGGSLDTRVDAFVEQRAAVNEALTPIRRAAFIHATGSEVVSAQFAAGHRMLRQQVERIFAVELAAREAGRSALADTLVLASSWAAWDLLRSVEGRSDADAAAAIRGVLIDALTSPQPDEGDGDPVVGSAGSR